jgi:asparagine synthase (glutamine-hydrolysing)
LGQPNKRLLVEAMGNLVPTSISQRTKMGFTLPFAQWMRNELKAYTQDRIMYLANYPFFQEHALHRLWMGFLANDGSVSWSRVWMLAVLGQWLQQNQIR